jgi:hypothetical protein
MTTASYRDFSGENTDDICVFLEDTLPPEVVESITQSSHSPSAKAFLSPQRGTRPEKLATSAGTTFAWHGGETGTNLLSELSDGQEHLPSTRAVDYFTYHTGSRSSRDANGHQHNSNGHPLQSEDHHQPMLSLYGRREKAPTIYESMPNPPPLPTDDQTCEGSAEAKPPSGRPGRSRFSHRSLTEVTNESSPSSEKNNHSSQANCQQRPTSDVEEKPDAALPLPPSSTIRGKDSADAGAAQPTSSERGARLIVVGGRSSTASNIGERPHSASSAAMPSSAVLAFNAMYGDPLSLLPPGHQSRPSRAASANQATESPGPMVPLAELKKVERERDRYKRMYEHQKSEADSALEKQQQEYDKLQEKITECIALGSRLEESKRFIRQLKKEVAAYRQRDLPYHNKALEDLKVETVIQKKVTSILKQQEAQFEELMEKKQTRMDALEALLGHTLVVAGIDQSVSEDLVQYADAPTAFLIQLLQGRPTGSEASPARTGETKKSDSNSQPRAAPQQQHSPQSTASHPSTKVRPSHSPLAPGRPQANQEPGAKLSVSPQQSCHSPGGVQPTTSNKSALTPPQTVQWDLSKLDGLLCDAYYECTSLVNDLRKAKRDFEKEVNKRVEVQRQLEDVQKEHRDSEIALANERRKLMLGDEARAEMHAKLQAEVLDLRRALAVARQELSVTRAQHKASTQQQQQQQSRNTATS